METELLALPPALRQKVEEERKRNEALQMGESALQGEGGYRSPQPEIIQDALTTLLLKKNLLLQGPTGSGKTKLAETLSYLLRKPLHMINCSVDLDAEAMLGYKTIVHQDGKATIQFVPGPVIRAMQQGHLLYIDEINMAKPETLPVLNSVLDYRKRMTNPFTGEVVQAQPGFAVIASINLGYIGTVALNEALKNRFVVIDVPYLQGEALAQLIMEQTGVQDQKLLAQFVQLSTDLVQQTRDGQLAEEAASIRALLDAADLSQYMPALRAIERAIVLKLDEERERALIRSIAETIFEA